MDALSKGSTEVIRSIASELKSVISYAVSDSNPEYIPNHFNNCLVKIEYNTYTSNMHEFITGDSVQFHANTNTELFYDIVNVMDEKYHHFRKYRSNIIILLW